MSASRASVTIPFGQTAVFTISVASLGGMAGNVAPSCAGAPPNSTCVITPSSVALNGATTVTATVAIDMTPPKNVDHGTFNVVFTGTLGTVTHTAGVSLTVR